MSNPADIERQCRKPGWSRGLSVVLPDGSTWWLARLRPEHAGRLPKLAAHLRAVADGSSFVFDGAEDPGALDRTVGSMAGVVAEALALQYAIQPDAHCRAMRAETVALRDRRLLGAIRELIAAVREGGLSRRLLLFAPTTQCSN